MRLERVSRPGKAVEAAKKGIDMPAAAWPRISTALVRSRPVRPMPHCQARSRGRDGTDRTESGFRS
jgi:hypothetical protein